MPATERVDRATSFARQVVDGEIVAGKKLRLACERHLRDLEEGEARGLRWRPDLSEKVLAWFPAFCVHFEGPKAGQALELAPWQWFLIGVAFGWQRWDEERQLWLRRFRRIFCEVAKKNGKSLIAGGLGLYLAFYDGEPGAKVFAAATKRAQAQLVWGASKVMVQKSRALKSRILVRHLTLSHPRSNSTYIPLGKDTKTEDGINPNGVIVDEIHRHEDDSLIQLLVQSFGARLNPMLWEITTAGTVGISVWSEEHDYAVQVLEGVLEDDSLFAVICNLDDDDDPFDEAVWPKSNPNLGVSVFRSELRERAVEAQSKPGARQEFLRLRMNVRTQSDEKWMVPALWKASSLPGDEWAGRIAYGGLDLGSRSDLAALVLVVPELEPADPPADWQQRLDIFCHFWCPEVGIDRRSQVDRVPYRAWWEAGLLTATPGDVTDYDRIRADVNAIVNPLERGTPFLDVFEVGYDPHDATQLVTQLTADGFQMVKVIQSHGEMDPAVGEVERMLALRRFRHGGHPILAWMVDNTVMVEDAAGRRKADKRRAREKIDGVPALLMAMKRWMANAGSEVTWGAA